MTFSKNILIVDDNPDDQQLICFLFKRSQFCFIPTFASSLTNARQLFKERRFDIITLDGDIPGFQDGGMAYNLIPDIRNSKSSQAKIIMISAEQKHIESGLKLGADHGLNKIILRPDVKISSEFEPLPAKVRETS